MTQTYAPRGAWITVNRGCNFRCAGCYAAGTGYDTKEEMDLAFAERILGIVEGLRIRHITTIGGEPTLWGSLLDFNRMCAARSVETTLVTNAMRFSSDDFWAAYQVAPNTKLGISVKAHDAQSLVDVARVTAFDKVELGIRRGLTLMHGGVSAVLGAGAAPDHVARMARFSMDCGARWFRLSPCTPSFEGGKPDITAVMHPHEVVKYVVAAYPEIDRITGGRFSLSPKLPLCLWPRDFVDTLSAKGQLNTVCQLHKHAGVIFGVDGSAFICNSLYEFPVGKLDTDFTDADSLLDILNGERAQALYKPLTSYASPKCVTCPMHPVCAGGCPLFWTVYDPKEMIPGWVS